MNGKEWEQVGKFFRKKWPPDLKILIYLCGESELIPEKERIDIGFFFIYTWTVRNWKLVALPLALIWDTENCDSNTMAVQSIQTLG